MNWIKRWFCRHKFHLLTTYETDVSRDSNDIDIQEQYIIYCPKCRTEQTVSKTVYEATMKRQEIDSNHARDKEGKYNRFIR